MSNVKHAHYKVTWSPEDGEYVGLCAEFPSLSHLDKTPEAALGGICNLVVSVVADLQASREKSPLLPPSSD